MDWTGQDLCDTLVMGGGWGDCPPLPQGFPIQDWDPPPKKQNKKNIHNPFFASEFVRQRADDVSFILDIIFLLSLWAFCSSPRNGDRLLIHKSIRIQTKIIFGEPPSPPLSRPLGRSLGFFFFKILNSNYILLNLCLKKCVRPAE